MTDRSTSFSLQLGKLWGRSFMVVVDVNGCEELIPDRFQASLGKGEGC